MPKGKNNKLKLYYLAKIMLKETDDKHFIGMPQIISALNAYGITADRKTIYTDLQELALFGIEVKKKVVNSKHCYHVVSRPFELAELKLLVDAIQSSKFITARKTNELIKKLETLVSKHEANNLQRQVFVSRRVKTMNESIYHNVDAIHNAISGNKKIQFQYLQWTIKKEMKPRHNGDYYQISPLGLSWSEENYYMIGYDSEAERIKHYRVDKMDKISMLDEKREGNEHFEKLDMADYEKKSFRMYSGEEQSVKLLVKNNLVGVIIDRFGKDVMIFPKGKDYFTVNVNVRVSRPFFGWIVSLGEGIKIISPDEVVEKMKKEIERLQGQYFTENQSK